MSNKNPFEIRAEVLELAKDYLDQHIKINTTFAEAMFKQGQLSLEEFQKASQMYTMDELMEKAKEMYNFVSTK